MNMLKRILSDIIQGFKKEKKTNDKFKRKEEVTEVLNIINDYFDQGHKLVKKNRTLEKLYDMLIYKSTCYKESINEIQKMYSSKREKFEIDPRKYDLVAVSIAVRGKKMGCFGTSHRVLEDDTYERKIKTRLNSILGEIGKVSLKTNCKNIIGKCAEVKAANNVLKLERRLKVQELVFTNAIRPRSLEVIPRCNNCKAVFGDE